MRHAMKVLRRLGAILLEEAFRRGWCEADGCLPECSSNGSFVCDRAHDKQ
jgi:hypothetical protein